MPGQGSSGEGEFSSRVRVSTHRFPPRDAWRMGLSRTADEACGDYKERLEEAGTFPSAANGRALHHRARAREAGQRQKAPPARGGVARLIGHRRGCWFEV